MKIWFFNHYASTPDQPVTGAYYLAKSLAGLKHEVTVFASSYSYYKRREIRLNKGELFKREKCEGVNFVWVRTFPYKSSLYARGLNMLSYFFMVIWSAIRNRERPDVVVGTCPHLLSVMAAYFVSLFKRSKFIFEVRDLWPQTFVDNGHLSKNNPVVVFLRFLEKYLYRKSDLIISVLPYAYEYIGGCEISKSKVVWIPNGVDLSNYVIPKETNGKLQKQFVIMYIGGHAKYHGIDILLQVAQLVKADSDLNVKFVFVGDGVEKTRLIRYTQEHELDNVEFRASVPRDDIGTTMNEATALIFHANSEIALKYGISSNKLCDYLMSGKPVLSTVNSRNNPVYESGSGICVPCDDIVKISDAIKTLVKMSADERAAMGMRGVKYAQEHYDAGKLAVKFEKVLSQL